MTRGYYDPPHTHEWAQFSYRLEGMAAIRAGEAAVVLPPGRGVWIPPGTVHEVSCRGPAPTPTARAGPVGCLTLASTMQFATVTDQTCRARNANVRPGQTTVLDMPQTNYGRKSDL